MAHGLSTIRRDDSPQFLMVMDRMDREVPTCRANESLRAVRERSQQKGYSVCAVINETGIVLGLVSEREWESDPTASVEQWMGPGPTTLRPSDSLEKAKHLLEKSPGGVLVTDSDGKLLAAFTGQGDKKQLPESEVWS
jgi:predicted transcriptional regulator